MTTSCDPDSEAYRQAVLHARAMTPEEKFLEGPRLFEFECEQMRAAIRHEMAVSCEEMVECELDARLAHEREVEERSIYVTLPPGCRLGL
jgi:hypothetical protein